MINLTNQYTFSRKKYFFPYFQVSYFCNYFPRQISLTDIQTFSFLFKRVFTREISSRDETHPRMKSSLSMVKYLFLFTRFCQDEILSRDELISVKKTAMKFHPWMNTRKKDVQTLQPGMKFYNEHVFT